MNFTWRDAFVTVVAAVVASLTVIYLDRLFGL